MLPADHQLNSLKKKNGESSPGGARPLEKEFGKGREMLPTDHQLTLKKMARVPPGGALPLEKKLAKEGKCFRQTTN